VKVVTVRRLHALPCGGMINLCNCLDMSVHSSALSIDSERKSYDIGRFAYVYTAPSCWTATRRSLSAPIIDW
jgi:hypothetical protein